MSDQNFLVMMWIVLITGVALLWFVVVKRTRGATSPQIFAHLTFPTILILSALFASRIKTMKAGPGGFQFNLDSVKAAATGMVRAKPHIAETLVSAKGNQAVKNAESRISAATSLEELQKVVPFQITDNSAVFHPTVNGSQIAIEATPAAPTLAPPTFTFDNISPDGMPGKKDEK